MFNCLPGAMLNRGIRTNVNRALAAVAFLRSIPLGSQKSQIIQSGAGRWRGYPLSTLRCVPRDTQRKTRGRADRYSFP